MLERLQPRNLHMCTPSPTLPLYLKPVHVPTPDVVVDGAPENVHRVPHDRGGVKQSPVGHRAVGGGLHYTPGLAVQVEAGGGGGYYVYKANILSAAYTRH